VRSKVKELLDALLEKEKIKGELEELLDSSSDFYELKLGYINSNPESSYC
jgi:hypothetical protein